MPEKPRSAKRCAGVQRRPPDLGARPAGVHSRFDLVVSRWAKVRRHRGIISLLMFGRWPGRRSIFVPTDVYGRAFSSPPVQTLLEPCTN